MSENIMRIIDLRGKNLSRAELLARDAARRDGHFRSHRSGAAYS